MSRLLLFAAVAATAFTSCSAYRSGQTRTPDDVYYSPAREGAAAAYVETDQKRDGYYRADDYSSAYDDRWLRMRVRDRYRWSAFDDYDWNYYNTMGYGSGLGWGYGYNPYWNYSLGFNSYWNAMYRWNSFYNPYCGGIIIVNPKVNQPAYTAVRNFSLDRYTNTNYNNANRPLSASKLGLRQGGSYTAPRYNNTNARSSNSLGSSIRKVFSNDNGSSRRDSYYSPGSNDRPTRTYTPSNSNSSTRSYTPSSSSSSSGSSGGGGNSGGGGGVSRPSRGN